IDPGAQQQAMQSVEPAMESQQLGRGQHLVKAEVLGEKSNPRAHRAIAQRRAEYVPRPRGRRDEREQHLDRRRLAGAVRSEEAEDLALAYLERQIRHRDRRTELLAQAVRFDHQRTDVAIAVTAETCSMLTSANTRSAVDQTIVVVGDWSGGCSC